MPKRKKARKYPKNLGQELPRKFRIIVFECVNNGTVNPKPKRVIAIAKTPSTKVSKRFLSLIPSSSRDLRLISSLDDFQT